MGEHDKKAKQGSDRPERAVAAWRPFGGFEAWPDPWERGFFPRRPGSLFGADAVAIQSQ